MWASFREYMQQTREHHRLVFSSREPTQWMMPTLLGLLPSRRITSPPVGPEALISRSTSRPV